MSLREYLDRLAAKEPVPGGGSASALVGAVSAALGSMVANFTVGREKFAAVEENMRQVLEALEVERRALTNLVQADMDAYGQVSAAYKMPKDDPTREETLQTALKAAASVPLEIVQRCLAVLRLLPELVEKGNPNLLSDVGVAAVCAEAGLKGGWLNVEINLAHLADEQYVASVKEALEACLGEAEALTRKLWQVTVDRGV